MKIINIIEAKTQLSNLIDQAVKGEAFIIAKAGKPLVKVIKFDAPEVTTPKRIGFMKGQIQVPDDFDTMSKSEITRRLMVRLSSLDQLSLGNKKDACNNKRLWNSQLRAGS